MRHPSSVVAYMARKRAELIDGVIRDVGAIQGIDSPEGVMLVTADELRAILLARLSLVPTSD